jgi:hypothetical protein
MVWAIVTQQATILGIIWTQAEGTMVENLVVASAIGYDHEVFRAQRAERVEIRGG